MLKCPACPTGQTERGIYQREIGLQQLFQPLRRTKITADSRNGPERGIYAHLCRFTVENTRDSGSVRREKKSSLKRHKCRAPVAFGFPRTYFTPRAYFSESTESEATAGSFRTVSILL